MIKKINIAVILLLISFSIQLTAQNNENPTIGIGVLNDSRVRVRNEPNLKGEHITYLNKNQIVNILDVTSEPMIIGDMESVWYKIETSDGIIGWAYGYFIDLEVIETEIINNQQIIKKFIEEEILPGRTSTIFRGEESLKVGLGKVEFEEIIYTDEKYMRREVDSIKKLKYDNFYAYFYQINDWREIFTYLEPRRDNNFSIINYGMILSNILNLDEPYIQHWDNTYVIYGSFHDTIAFIKITVDAEMRIDAMEIWIGEE